MIATVSRASMPAARSACVSMLVRRSTSAKVSVPRSSMIAALSGGRIAARR
jgi:hypothetical protein